MQRYAPVLLSIGLLTLAGCCGGVPPRDRAEAMYRVNSNLERITEPVQCSAWVSMKFRDSDGRVRRVPARDARLLFSAPHCMLFDVRSPAGVAAQFGSNDEYYWLWIEPEIRKLWIGRWAELADARQLAIPPDDLLDALVLRPLPETLEGGAAPELRMSGYKHWLIFRRVGPDGQLLGTREIRVSHCPPYQPREIIDRLPNGTVRMHVTLKTYERIGNDGPYTARHYVMQWPQTDAELRLDILRAKFRPDLDDPDMRKDIFMEPLDWDGEIEDLDTPPATGETW